MLTNLTINWTGISGTKYRFIAYPINTRWVRLGAVYIFAKPLTLTTWGAVYIGKAKDMADRHSDHEKESEAVRLGATHLHVHWLYGESDRGLVEADLIKGINPPLNQQLRTGPALRLF